jgi:O-antigen biosynthesis protein
MNISVVIPAYNHLEDVLVCLNTLQAMAADNSRVQYLIQDDASPQYDLRRLISPYTASVDRNPLNLGFSGNCNMGARRAAGDILFMVNQDIEAVSPLSQGWDDHLRAAFADERVGIVGARLLFPDGRLQSAGGEFDAHMQPYHRCIGYSDLDNWEIKEPREVAWCTGAALAIRRTVFDQIGGFDERYIGGYFEDVSMCLRARECGHLVWYTPAVTFIHKVGSTGGSPYFMQNAQLFKREWVDTRKVTPDVAAVLEGWW